MKICPDQPPIVPSEIPYTLDPNQGPVSDEDANRRFREHPAAQEWLEEHGDYHGTYSSHLFSWKDGWRQAPGEVILQVFTFSECVRIWEDSVIMSRLGDYLEKNHPFLWKVRNSAWRYGMCSSYERIVKDMEGLKRLRCDLPGFEVKLTCTSAYNEYGPSVHMREGWDEEGKVYTRQNLEPGQKDLYLDASYGLLLYYKGRHVLTVGFALARKGVMVAQVQLRHKKGNRFLYQLPCSYMDLALKMLAEAFPNDALYMVMGDCAPTAVRKAYGNEVCPMTSETEARITRFYNQRLGDYTRTTSRQKYYTRTFVRLFKRAARAPKKPNLRLLPPPPPMDIAPKPHLRLVGT